MALIRKLLRLLKPRQQMYVVKRMPIGFERDHLPLNRCVFIDLCSGGDSASQGKRPDIRISEME